jgi:hypothetical protein
MLPLVLLLVLHVHHRVQLLGVCSLAAVSMHLCLSSQLLLLAAQLLELHWDS